MQEHNLFRDYLDKICEQIRWKKAHSVVCRDLGDHLEDELAVLVESGIAEDEAANKAILDMGDAALVGSQLDRAYRPRPAWGIISIVAALMGVGFFARIYIVQHVTVNSNHVVDIPRDLFWLCAALVIAGLVLRGSIAVFVFGGVGGIMLTAMLLKGRFKVRKSFGLLILYVPVVLMFFWLWEAVRDRLFYMLQPELDSLGSGFQGVQIRQVLDNVRWIGQGGHPPDNIPELINSNMLTFFIYQFGWLSLVITLLLFGSLITLSTVLTIKQKSRLGRTLSVAILLSLAIQGGMYIANNLGFVNFGFPVLPLLSYGNAALLIDSFLIGLMLSVFRNDDVVRDPIITPKRIPRIKITMERLP